MEPNFEAILDVYSLEEILEMAELTPAETLRELWDAGILRKLPPVQPL